MNSAYSPSNDVAVASRCLAKWPGVYDDGVFMSERAATTGTVSALFQQALDIRQQWEAEGKILGEDLMLDAPPIFALGGI